MMQMPTGGAVRTHAAAKASGTAPKSAPSCHILSRASAGVGAILAPGSFQDGSRCDRADRHHPLIGIVKKNAI